MVTTSISHYRKCGAFLSSLCWSVQTMSAIATMNLRKRKESIVTAKEQGRRISTANAEHHQGRCIMSLHLALNCSKSALVWTSMQDARATDAVLEFRNAPTSWSCRRTETFCARDQISRTFSPRSSRPRCLAFTSASAGHQISWSPWDHA